MKAVGDHPCLKGFRAVKHGGKVDMLVAAADTWIAATAAEGFAEFVRAMTALKDSKVEAVRVEAQPRPIIVIQVTDSSIQQHPAASSSIQQHPASAAAAAEGATAAAGTTAGASTAHAAAVKAIAAGSAAAAAVTTPVAGAAKQQ